MGRKLYERGSEIRGIQGQMDEEEQWKDIATYTSRVCTIALVPDRTFASDFAVNVSGKKRFCQRGFSDTETFTRAGPGKVKQGQRYRWIHALRAKGLVMGAVQQILRRIIW